MSKSCLSTLNKSSSNITDSKGGLVRIDDMVINDWGDVYVDIVFGHTNLRRDFDDSDLDVNLLQFLTQSDD